MLLKVLATIFVGVVILTTVVFGFNQRQSRTNVLASPQPISTPNPTSSSIVNQKSMPSSLPTSSSFPAHSSTPQSSKIEITTNNSEITAEISNEALNSQIQSSLIGQSLGSTPLGDTIITSLTTTIEDGFILISGTAKNGFINVPFKTKVMLTLINNQPKISLQDLTLNSIPVPQIITDQLTSILQSKINDIINGYQFKLKSITIVSGKIILVGEK